MSNVTRQVVACMAGALLVICTIAYGTLLEGAGGAGNAEYAVIGGNASVVDVKEYDSVSKMRDTIGNMASKYERISIDVRV